ncbi:molybdopterin-guanine dinucleotide biosynthesis protein B [Fictibacillus sp. b24]|uniref:molybdopterin-guanine dinucleotide biosynthesis protein B n=1 Tax=Fictibacillus sp. b24 TaxID=3055863 RepID=UPI0025A0C71B|nr:molybdopterin-guanine dinucleotide biosynthesis protein B [Fictibacillus sp. b24]MDM5316801.1 molybdopterin-guanine dinucleotide biosynthesis protein B [Fictibacillus sp. b24]
MALEPPVILQVVGYQNSGKTTLITKLIKRLEKHRLQTGVIKHHGHGDTLELNDFGKDTERHRNAGAYITSVTSAKNSILSLNSELSIDQVIAIYTVLKMDCILIEGYKKFQYPRVVLFRDNKGEEDLLSQSEHVIARIHGNQIEQSTDNTHFYWAEEEKWLDYLSSYILKCHKERKGS